MTVACLESLTFGLGHLVRAAALLDERLLLLSRDPAYYTYELDRLPAGDLDVVVTDTFDVERVADLLQRTPGLPGLDPTVLRLTRDKATVRNRLHEMGLTRGRAVESAGPDSEARGLLLKEVGLPAVLKDTAGTGSQNVWLARDEGELDAALAEASGRGLEGRLFAEPYFSGPVYSAETLTWPAAPGCWVSPVGSCRRSRTSGRRSPPSPSPSRARSGHRWSVGSIECSPPSTTPTGPHTWSAC
jgi:hypothetical protein